MKKIIKDYNHLKFGIKNRFNFGIHAKLVFLLILFFSTAMIAVFTHGMINNIGTKKYIDKPKIQANLSRVDLLNQKIKNNGGTWSARENKISKMSETELRKLLGVLLTPEELVKIENNKNLPQVISEQNLPINFDWRDQHGGLDYVTPVKDQSTCGSCWAFADVGMLEASIATHYNRPVDYYYWSPPLSEQDFVSCMSGYGCSGVTYWENLDFLRKLLPGSLRKGITTNTCYPYRACDNARPSCPACSTANSCRINNEYGIDQVIEVASDVDEIKQALMDYGPLFITMAVYDDFPSYDSGIYRHVTGGVLGGHAILLVGWGNYDGLDYWIVKNSWGPHWGESGYFRIYVDDPSIMRENALAVVKPTIIGGVDPVVNCVDQDNDGYCYWGVGSKPSNCPACSDYIADCDDGNNGISSNCNTNYDLPYLTINTNANGAAIYVKALDSDDWVYRGVAPLTLNLNSGDRYIKASRVGYFDRETHIQVDQGGNYHLNISLDQDPVFLTGWPINLSEISTESALSVADINNDLKLDLIVVNYINDALGYINVYDLNGRQMAGWPRLVDTTDRPGKLSSPAIADINHDSFPEIIFAADTDLFVFNHDGGVLWSKDLSSDLQPAFNFNPIVYDLDNDGNMDIIHSTQSKLYVFNSNGTLKSGWPKYFPNDLQNGALAAVANIDADEDIEIILNVVRYIDGSNLAESQVIIYNFDGSIQNQWLVRSAESYLVSPFGVVIGDIDKNGSSDIVVGDKGFIYAYNYNGQLLSGWPLDIRPYDSFGSITSLGLFNDNGLGFLRIFASTYNSIILINHLGQVMPGWPKINTSNDGASVADINGDQVVDILAGSRSGGLYAWSLQGNLLPSFPKNTGDSFKFSPMISDFNGDGKSEIIHASSDYLYIWRTNSPYSVQQWSATQRYNQRTGNINDYPLCSDNTTNGSCSTRQPFLCKAGSFINSCLACGCPSGYKCQSNGRCLRNFIVKPPSIRD